MRKLILREPELHSTFPQEPPKGLRCPLVIKASRHGPDRPLRDSFRLKHICFIIPRVLPLLSTGRIGDLRTCSLIVGRTIVFRITDLGSGMAVDISIRDVTVDSFREQLARGVKKPKNRTMFLRRLEYRIEEAIEESLDLTLQPPKTGEQTEAVFRAMTQNISIPP